MTEEAIMNDRRRVAELEEALNEALSLVPRHAASCSIHLSEWDPASDFCSCARGKTLARLRALVAPKMATTNLQSALEIVAACPHSVGWGPISGAQAPAIPKGACAECIAGFPNNQVACVNCKKPVTVTALNAIRCDECRALSGEISG